MSTRQMIGVMTAAMALACGCADPGAPASTSEKAKVSGTVRRQGKPVSGGTIAFNPANSKRRMAPTSVAVIGEDGTYSVETLVGGNKLNVFPPADGVKQAFKDAKTDKVAPGVAGPGGFQERLEVKSGDNVHDVEM